MGKPVDDMTYEDWKKITIYLMRANEMVAAADRDQSRSAQSDHGGSSDHWYNRTEVGEVREAASEIGDATWLKLGIFVGKEL